MHDLGKDLGGKLAQQLWQQIALIHLWRSCSYYILHFIPAVSIPRFVIDLAADVQSSIPSTPSIPILFRSHPILYSESDY